MTAAEVSGLVEMLAKGIRVFVQRGVAELTEDQIYDRARNQAQALLGNYFIVPMPEGVTERRPQRDDLAFRHMYGCHCGNCPGEFDVTPTPRVFPKVTELRELYAQGKPEGHGHSCACRDCRAFNQTRRAQ